MAVEKQHRKSLHVRSRREYVVARICRRHDFDIHSKLGRSFNYQKQVDSSAGHSLRGGDVEFER
jgi:hypothetical protein